MSYQYFGSADSLDTDIVFFVDQLPSTIRECSDLCKALSEAHAGKKQSILPVNGNLAVLQDGYITQVHKGTADELNNALYDTYSLHRQDFPLMISGPLQRDIQLKFLRCTRIILSALTRTLYRRQVKKALQEDLANRIFVLKQTDLELITETAKGFSLTDIQKLLAFQLGQTLLLHNGTEVYTKQAVAQRYPQLVPQLYRSPSASVAGLNIVLQEFITALEERLPHMDRTEEYEYRRPGI